MLVHLHISHYALIDRLDIDFECGFSVLTGETGAGKSIILGALGLLLGRRAEGKVIQTGQAKCCIEGTFDVKRLNLQDFFAANDLDYDDVCIVRREVSQSGKSRAFINDSPVALTTMKALGDRLFDIHSQHQNLLLGREDFLLGTLDSVGQNADLLTRYGESFDAWKKAQGELDEMRKQAEKDAADREYLAYQLKQLEEADLHDGEQEELEQEQKTLAHAEDIQVALTQALSALQNDERDAVADLKNGAQTLAHLADFLPDAASWSERMDSVRIELDDLLGEMAGALQQVESDPNRLQFIDDRLATIYSLQKKFGASDVAELIRKTAELRERVDKIENIDGYIAEKQAEVDALYAAIEKEATQLTDSRKAAADELTKAVKEQVGALGMPNASLLFDFAAKNAPDRSGFDNVRFLFSANKNVPPQDVSQIASGGEMGRLMLAFKAFIARHEQLPTVIFDEIDTGVSGTMAEKMAKAMQALSKGTQVLCITHLPQIAAAGEHHFLVYKEETADGAETHISQLNEAERVDEVANMLSGETLTPEAIENAKSLLKQHTK